MRVLIAKDAFENELAVLKGVHGRKLNEPGGAPSTTVTPIRLEAVLDRGDDLGTLRLTCADYANRTTVSVPCRVVKVGAVEAPLSILSSLVSNCYTPDVTLDGTDERLSIESDQFAATLAGVVAAIPMTGWGAPNGQHQIKVDVPTFKKAIQTLQFATPVFEDTRTGMRLEPTVDNEVAILKLVATNGHCLGILSIPCEGTGSPVALTKSTIDTLMSVARGDDGTLALSYSDDANVVHGTVVATGVHREFVTKRKNVVFVDYAKIIPAKDQRQMSVVADTKDVAAAVKRVKLMTNLERTGITISVESGQIHFSSHADGFESAESVEALEVAGAIDNCKLKLDHRYLGPMLLGITEPKVEFSIYGDMQPVTIGSEGSGVFVFGRMRL